MLLGGDNFGTGYFRRERGDMFLLQRPVRIDKSQKTTLR